MLTCIIVDDEPQAITLLAELIREVPDLDLRNASTDAMDMLTYLRSDPVDLIFLDVQMPKLGGMDFMQLARHDTYQPAFILTTAYAEYGVQGFDADAADYLLKPFSRGRFLKAVQKVFSLRQPAMPSADEPGYFFVKADNKNKAIKIDLEDILYIEGSKNYVSIFTTETRIMTLVNMKDVEARLPQPQFLRVHRSFIIPTKRIERVEGNRIFMRAATGNIPLGETYRERMSSFLNRNSLT